MDALTLLDAALSDADPLMKAEGCVKRYGTLTALDGVSFSVREGEVVTLLGPNGSGKTTLMRAVGATLRLDAGTIWIGGLSVADEPRAVKAMLGVVHQEDTLDPDLGVRENLLVYARYHGLPRAAAWSRSGELLERFGLASRAADPIATLSGGMRRRLMLARAFFKARLLVLDEPTTGLDPEARLTLWADIRSLLADGVGVVLTTHDMEEAERLSDRVLLMDRGRVRATGSPSELIAAETAGVVHEIRLPVARLGEAAAIEDALRKRIDDARVRRHGGFLFVELASARENALRAWALDEKLPLTERPANLGDVYLAATGRGLEA